VTWIAWWNFMIVVVSLSCAENLASSSSYHHQANRKLQIIFLLLSNSSSNIWSHADAWIKLQVSSFWKYRPVVTIFFLLAWKEYLDGWYTVKFHNSHVTLTGRKGLNQDCFPIPSFPSSEPLQHKNLLFFPIFFSPSLWTWK
jgi:hypothetical protein